MLKKNSTYGKQRISRSMQIVGPIQLHFFIRKLQVMNVLLKETDWLCYTFFHQEIAGDGPALQGDRLALLHIFSSGSCRWWTCSSRKQIGFALLGELHERGQTHKRTDFATTRKNWPKGRFFEIVVLQCSGCKVYSVHRHFKSCWGPQLINIAKIHNLF